MSRAGLAGAQNRKKVLEHSEGKASVVHYRSTLPTKILAGMDRKPNLLIRMIPLK
jgi:hypothetical protein